MNNIINWLINKSNLIVWLVKDSIQFNDFSLMTLTKSNVWIVVKNNDNLWLDNIKLKTSESQNSNWWKILDKTYWIKKISLELFIQGSSYSDLLTRIDELKKNLDWINWKLYIEYNWQTRVYEATCDKVNIWRINSLDDFADSINIDFQLSWPFWILEDVEVDFSSWKTTDFQKIITNLWTYKSYPKFIFIWKTWSTITQINIEILELWATSWYNVTIPVIIWNNDIFEIDYGEKTAKLNWIEKQFFWFMTALKVNTNLIKFSFIWTINIDTYILYSKTYL